MLAITVNTLMDEADGSILDGDISLRDAINLAAPDETINFAVTGTINLTFLGELPIRKNLTIAGPGANVLTIAAYDPTPTMKNGDGQRIFRISDNTTGLIHAQINGLTLAGADIDYNAGGAILSFENLTVTNSTISGNSTRGFIQGLFNGHGGGIASYAGSLSITNSTIQNNQAMHGGGIFSRFGNVTITNSTISENLTSYNGGGISSWDSNLTITGSTISGNDTSNQYSSAGGGVYLRAGSLSITDSVFSTNSAYGQGGGIHAGYSDVMIEDSTFDGNIVDFGSAGAISVNKADLTITGTTISNNTARFGGGGIGFRDTNATITGSMILDNTAGGVNFSGGGIHSWESVLAITGTTISGNTTSGSGGGIAHLTGSLEVTNCTIQDNDAQYGGGIFSQFVSVTITDSTISDNLGISGGAGIHNSDGNLIVTGSKISGNETRNNYGAAGGGLFHQDGSLNIAASTISENSAYGAGGGIFARDAVAVIIGSTISSNESGFESGGGIAVSSADLTITRTTISDNLANGNGGGVIAHGTNLTITHSAINGNTANRGGGIFSLTNLSTLTTTILNSTISGNVAAVSGGGMINYTGLTVIRQSTITDNQAPANAGGGVASRATSTQTQIGSSIIAGNTAGGDVQFVDGATNSVISLGYNLVGSGNAAGAFSPVGGDLIGLSPLLGPLTYNGGPTQTHAPLVGSPAIDAGDPSFASPGFDQRGAPFARVFGGRIDIGAYERQTVAGLNLIVDTAADENDGNYSASDLSLREAIGLANGSVGANTVSFAAALSGQAIMLGGTELSIGETLLIDARPLAENVTINADQQSRIFNITASSGDFTFGGLNLIGGRTNATNIAGAGGAIRSLSLGNLTLDQSIVSGNSTTEMSAAGGGILAYGNVTLTQSTVSGNSTTANDGPGGGIFAAGTVTLSQSTVSGNSTAGAGSIGGGIVAFGAVTLTQSTVSGNRTTGSSGYGGGIWTLGAVTLTQSTVTGNRAFHATAMGGGVVQVNTSYNFPFLVSGTILAGNTAGGGGADLVKDPQSTLDVNYSLVGTGITLDPDSSGNIVTNTPQLAPLANNGGTTQTHAPLADSPAIDAGDPGFSSPPSYDQRGAPYLRVFDGDGISGARIDIGAFELQPEIQLPDLVGDYNVNGFVDAADYTVWRNSSGQTGLTPYSGADGNGDGDITFDDYLAWKNNYGQTSPVEGAGTESNLIESQPQTLIATSSASPSACAFNYDASHSSKDSQVQSRSMAGAVPPVLATSLPESWLGADANRALGAGEGSLSVSKPMRNPSAAALVQDAALLALLTASHPGATPRTGELLDFGIDGESCAEFRASFYSVLESPIEPAWASL